MMLALLAACADGESPRGDLGPDLLPPSDLLAADGDGGKAATADFVVQGCTRWSLGQCLGTVPLTLTFSALVQGHPTVTSWDFGDGSPPGSGLVVQHTFSATGVRDVSLVISEGNDTVSEQKKALVKVTAVPSGGPCQKDAHCARGTCVCSGTCAPPLSDGFCLDDCSGLSACAPLPDALVALACVDLRGGAVTAPVPWRGQVCLPLCTADVQCTRPGFSCRPAPGKAGWRRVCLPPTPGDAGDPCRKADGTTDATACIGGVCLDVGASGLCSADCAKGACPTGSRCATFPGQSNRALCLDICGTGDCAADPRLACELPNKTGAWGFVVSGNKDPEGTRYCAPRRCTSAAQCGLAGRCDSKNGGFCVPDK